MGRTGLETNKAHKELCNVEILRNVLQLKLKLNQVLFFAIFPRLPMQLLSILFP